MKFSNFDYFLPKKLIAQKPISPRDHSKLLVLKRKSGKILHWRFFQIEKFFKKGDILVLNNSKVIPARLLGFKKTGGRVEVLLLKQKERLWEALINTRKPKILLEIFFKKGLVGRIVKNLGEEIFLVKFNFEGKKFNDLLKKIGETPLPPYIKSKEKDNKIIEKQYQTVYADSKKEGSVAAPTAGFHFTKRLIYRLKQKGVQIEFVTLHVGLGTFKPVKCKNIKDHKMHAEYAEINKATIRQLLKAKKEGRRIIACGTTSVRVLETVLPKFLTTYDSPLNTFNGFLSTFIYPGFKFKVVDAIITNFHLPKTTLLMLVSAFAGKKLIDRAYQEAISKNYRFYSFGDAMLIC